MNDDDTAVVVDEDDGDDDVVVFDCVDGVCDDEDNKLVFTLLNFEAFVSCVVV